MRTELFSDTDRRRIADLIDAIARRHGRRGSITSPIPPEDPGGYIHWRGFGPSTWTCVHGLPVDDEVWLRTGLIRDTAGNAYAADGRPYRIDPDGATVFLDIEPSEVPHA